MQQSNSFARRSAVGTAFISPFLSQFAGRYTASGKSGCPAVWEKKISLGGSDGPGQLMMYYFAIEFPNAVG